MWQIGALDFTILSGIFFSIILEFQRAYAELRSPSQRTCCRALSSSPGGWCHSLHFRKGKMNLRKRPCSGSQLVPGRDGLEAGAGGTAPSQLQVLTDADVTPELAPLPSPPRTPARWLAGTCVALASADPRSLEAAWLSPRLATCPRDPPAAAWTPRRGLAPVGGLRAPSWACGRAVPR